MLPGPNHKYVKYVACQEGQSNILEQVSATILYSFRKVTCFVLRLSPHWWLFGHNPIAAPCVMLVLLASWQAVGLQALTLAMTSLCLHHSKRIWRCWNAWGTQMQSMLKRMPTWFPKLPQAWQSAWTNLMSWNKKWQMQSATQPFLRRTSFAYMCFEQLCTKGCSHIIYIPMTHDICPLDPRMLEKVNEMYNKIDKLCDDLNNLHGKILLDGMTESCGTQPTTCKTWSYSHTILPSLGPWLVKARTSAQDVCGLRSVSA